MTRIETTVQAMFKLTSQLKLKIHNSFHKGNSRLSFFWGVLRCERFWVFHCCICAKDKIAIKCSKEAK